jgi:hypothetical protein
MFFLKKTIDQTFLEKQFKAKKILIMINSAFNDIKFVSKKQLKFIQISSLLSSFTFKYPLKIEYFNSFTNLFEFLLKKKTPYVWFVKFYSFLLKDNKTLFNKLNFVLNLYCSRLSFLFYKSLDLYLSLILKTSSVNYF